MFMPSARVWKEMQYEPASFWPVPINQGDECAFLLKVHTHLIKAAYRSCPVKLSVATTRTSLGRVMVTILSIANDPASPLSILGVCRHKEEQLALTDAFRLGHTLLVFFDELSRPVARAHCVLEPLTCNDALTCLQAYDDLYVGPWNSTMNEVLDEIEAIIDPINTVQTNHDTTLVSINLALTQFETIEIVALGDREVRRFRLEDPDEGHGLEQTTWHLLVDLFGQNIFHSPQVTEWAETREITDILAFCDAGVILFEAKAAAVLTTNPNRSTERRAKNIQKQIKKGIAQLLGGMRSISSSLPLTAKSGNSIQFPDGIGPNHIGIIMVSELLPSVDWNAIAQQLIDASKATDTLLLVLDLQELRFLVGVSKDPIELMTRLIKRFMIMADVGSAFIRTRLQGPPLP